MIQKINYFKLKCDICDKEEIFYNGYLTHIQSARNKGWAIARNRLNCYCPNCAINMRNIGKETALKIYEIKHKEKKNYENTK